MDTLGLVQTGPEPSTHTCVRLGTEWKSFMLLLMHIILRTQRKEQGCLSDWSTPLFQNCIVPVLRDCVVCIKELHLVQFPLTESQWMDGGAEITIS